MATTNTGTMKITVDHNNENNNYHNNKKTTKKQQSQQQGPRHNHEDDKEVGKDLDSSNDVRQSRSLALIKATFK